MKAQGDLLLRSLRPAAPWVTAWPVRGLAAFPDGGGYAVLESGGRVLGFDWEGDGEPRLVAPALPWTRPLDLLRTHPDTDHGDSRIVALSGGRVVRFLSTEVRHVSAPMESRVELWTSEGRLLRCVRIKGVCPVLLDVRGDGAEALIGWPGRYAADAWPSVWIPVPLADAGPVEALASTHSAGIAAGPLVDLAATWRPASDAGDARALRASQRAAAPSLSGMPADVLGRLPEPATLVACAPDGQHAVAAAGDVLAAQWGGNDRWTCGVRPLRRADAFPRFDFDALRDHLPAPLPCSEGRGVLTVRRDWEMADAYQSVDVWTVEITSASPGVRRTVRLPAQPVSWEAQHDAACVLLRDASGGFMRLDLDGAAASTLHAEGASPRVALTADGRLVARRSPFQIRPPRGASVEIVEPATGRVVFIQGCAPGELPLGVSGDGGHVLLACASSLRVMRMSDGCVLHVVDLETDEADEARCGEEAFVITTRRGAMLSLGGPALA
ncbi:MAG: hypothetical protein EB084_15895 [Proteobacteria bacterium]|nr:hypothetical protein [Pseudomonadota bacterium]